MTVKKRTKTANALNGLMPPASYRDAVTRQLSQLPQVDAIFVLTDDANVVHVFSVVREFPSKIYAPLLKKEKAVQKRFPGIAFDFHVRAHQGRAPAEAVPFEAELVYAR
jgi:hypothetical protein